MCHLLTSINKSYVTENRYQSERILTNLPGRQNIPRNNENKGTVRFSDLNELNYSLGINCTRVLISMPNCSVTCGKQSFQVILPFLVKTDVES